MFLDYRAVSINPFKPNGVSLLSNWSGPFQFYGLLGGIFIQILIEHSVSKWVCTVGLCPTKRMLGWVNDNYSN